LNYIKTKKPTSDYYTATEYCGQTWSAFFHPFSSAIVQQTWKWACDI